MQQDVNKTNAELLDELRELRQKHTALEGVAADLKKANTHLKQSEERFRAIANYGCDWETWVAPNGKIKWLNPAVKNFTGYSGDEYMNLPDRLQQIIGDNDRDKIISHFAKGLKQQKSANDVEFQIKHKDGALKWVSVSYQPMYADNGKYLGLRSSIRDISKRKQVEKALRESETRFRAIAESSPDAIITTDSTGKILYWNKAAETIYGYKAKEIVEKSIELLRPEGKRPVDRNNRENFIKTGRSPYIGKTVEGPARKKDGTDFLSETSTSYWKSGEQIFFSGIVRDVTERKLLEKSLQQEKFFSDTVINSLPGVYYLVDGSGNFVRWNRNLEVITGYSAKRLLKTNAFSLIHEDDSALAKNKVKDIINNNGDAEVDVRLLVKNGTARHYFFTGSRVDVDGHTYITGLGIDITERKHMEHELKNAHEELGKKVKQRTAELREANKRLQISEEYLKKFAGLLLSAREEERKNISTTLHDELGSMALSVDSQISIAKEECKQNNKQATFTALAQAQAALRKSVEDLRRVAVDLRPPNLEIIGLTAALTDLLDKVKQQAKFKITFRNELGNKKISDDMAIVIYRVIQEALTNIMKHAKAKTARISLYAEKRNIKLEISDDGAGCDLQKALYKKGKPKIGIEGMRERVESLGGEFIITSAPNRGTQLKARLPKK
jgi:PAS domain S-box-containing protein